MTHHHRILGLTCSSLILLALPLSGQPKVLTLDQARQYALQRNINVLQSQNAVDAAAANRLAAQGAYLPSLSTSAGWNHTQTNHKQATTTVIAGQPFEFPEIFNVTNSFSTGLDAGLTIFDGLRREASLSSASSAEVSAEQRALWARQTIANQVYAAYFNVLRTQQLVKVSEENLKRDQRQLERITESNRVGALSLADVYRQQSQVAQDELDVIKAQNDFDFAKADLLALIGFGAEEEYEVSDPGIAVEFSEEDLATTREKYSDLATLTRQALGARADYVGTVEDFNAAQADVRAARSGYFPRVSAFAGYSLSNTEISTLSDNKSLNWGLNLQWNLFDNFQTNRALEAATVGKRNAEVTLTQAERDISVQVKKAMLLLESARKSLDVARKGLRSAQEDRRIAEERYNLGAGTLLDLLVANAGLVSSEAARINAAYVYVAAKRNMEYALGERVY